MLLGFINFSDEERSKMNQVTQAIRGSQAIDELGLGRIRDAFSNLMFPGMSVLHSRAKYYAILPALYKQVENGRYKTPREVRRKIVELEIKLTKQLLLGTENLEEQKGITGSTMIEQAEKNPENFVKYDPSYIYASALVTYGMVKSNGSLYQLIMERANSKTAAPEKYKVENDEEELQDDQDGEGGYELFDTGGLKYVFDGKTPIPIQLNAMEAQFIKSKIIMAQGAKDSLLAFLLKKDVPVSPDYMELGLQWSSTLPDELYTTYLYSCRFSKFQYLLRLLYNYSFYDKTVNEEERDMVLEFFKGKKVLWKDEITVESIEEVLDYVEPLVRDNNTISFSREALRLLYSSEPSDMDNLLDLIKRREITIKGITRSKLANPNKLKGTKHADAYFLNYRWNLVYSVIQEIREGLRHG